ncbi:MAG: aminotransferase class IV [candidate division KSB1 bacterium]|nr:aminotransferase class IV [candidate division KSB1 bacterium]
MLVYYNGHYMQESEVCLPPYERGFQFADGVYEVIRCYYGVFFQTEAHLARMARGLSELRIQAPDLSAFPAIIQRLVEENNHDQEQAIAYLQVTRGAYSPRRHWFPPAGTPPTVYISTSPFKPHWEEIEQGVKVILEEDIRWLRCDIKSIALLPNVLSRQRAIDQGAVEAIWARDGFMTEGTHCNVGFVRDGTFYTPPLSNLILPGVTRAVVLRLCEDLGIPAREVEIARAELAQFDEAMLIGTTVEITPIVQIGEMQVGTGVPGPITRRLQEAFYEKVLPAGARP